MRMIFNTESKVIFFFFGGGGGGVKGGHVGLCK